MRDACPEVDKFCGLPPVNTLLARIAGTFVKTDNRRNLPYPGDAKLEAFSTFWDNQIEGQQKPLFDESFGIPFYENRRQRIAHHADSKLRAAATEQQE